VESEARGRGHVYRAAGDPDEVTAQSISSLLAATADPRAALAHFVEGLDDPKLVAELAELLERELRRPVNSPSRPVTRMRWCSSGLAVAC